MLNCCNCKKEVQYGEYNEVFINVNAYCFEIRKRPYGYYIFCDDCLGVTKKLKEVRQVTDPPVEEPLGIFAKIKRFFTNNKFSDLGE